MALLFMDSFDHYATADLTTKWTQASAGNFDSSVVAAVGRHASNGWQMKVGNAGDARSMSKTLTPADNTIVVGVAFKCVSAFASLYAGTDPDAGSTNNGPCVLLVRHANVNQCWVRLNQNGTLSVYRGTTVLGTTSVSLVQGTYAYLELLLTIHDTAGVVRVRVNGTDVLSLTSQNTRGAAANAWNELRLGFFSVATGGMEWDWDDLYVLDGSGAAPWNTVLGDCRVDARVPTGAGATTGWTPSTAPNWSCVDDAAPNGDTDYVATSTLNATDTYVTQDAPVVGATLYGVQHCVSMKKMDAGTCTVAPVIRHSGVDYPGTAIAPSTSYGFGLQVAQVNPGTSAAWTEAGFNNAEFGVKKTA